MGHQDVYSSGNNAIVSNETSLILGLLWQPNHRLLSVCAMHGGATRGSASSPAPGSYRHDQQDRGWEDAEGPRDLGDVIFNDVKKKKKERKMENFFSTSLHQFDSKICFA